MKKVMVLTVVIMLLAASAFAGIRNTKHDLSNAGDSGQGDIVSTNYNEVCVFCHTPHGGATGGLAPLWNRSADFSVYDANDLYNSVTLETDSQPTQVVDAVNASDAKLCMACHDGTTLDDGLFNPANSSQNAQPIFNGTSNAVSGDADLGGTSGTDLTDDHPIGMNYDTVENDDGELVSSTTVGNDTYVGVTDVPLYSYDSTNVMWCSSCHDVHSDEFSPFLNISNVGSDLCVNCHIK